MDQLN